ncbi:MAG: hypothetical protein R6V85_10345 [Polyangia bacterium]
MRRAIATAGILALALAFGGCTYVASSRAPSTSVTGEVWYTKDVWFLGLNFATKVFYCPAPTAKGPATCKQAIIHEEGEAPAPSGFGMPSQGQGGYGAPAQGGYGAPAQPQPPRQPQPSAPGYQPQQPQQPQPQQPQPQEPPPPPPPPPGFQD